MIKNITTDRVKERGNSWLIAGQRLSPILFLLLFGVGNVWGGDSYIDAFGIQFYEDGSSSYIKTNGDIDDNTKLSFGNKTCDWTISYIYANVKKNGENVCGDTWFGYQIYGNTGTSWTSNQKSEDSWTDDYHYAKWGSENSSSSRYIELVKNRLPGDYNLQFIFSWKCDGSCNTTRYCKYSGNNWKFSWTIPDPTITITGASSLVAGTSTNITATISNYPVGATLTNLQVSGNIASTKSNTGSGSSITVSSVVPNASGSNGITVTATVTFGTAGTKTYTYYYNVTPPAVSNFTVTPSGTGYLSSGSGTSESPWLVTYNGSLTLGLSGATKAYDDGNASPQYSTDGTNYGTSGTYISKTINDITSTTNSDWIFRARLKNNTTSSLVGSVKQKQVYWKVPTYTVTLNMNGSYTSSGSATATHGRNSLSSITAPKRTGYDVSGYYTNDATPVLIAATNGSLQASTAYTDASSKWNVLSGQTLYAHWTAHIYTVTLAAGTGGSGSGTMTIEYDATGYKTWTSDITQTGYHINGWYDNGESLKVLNDNGTFAASDVTGYITSGKWSKASDCTLQAWWDPNNYTVTLDVDEDHQGSIAGATTIHTVTFNTITTTIPNRPTAEQGYGLDGYYTDHNGAGTKLINGNGTFIASVDGYTDGEAKWIRDGGVTLYAYYKKSEITGLAFDASIVAPSATVYVTPTISPAPAGSTTICWRVLYANGNPLASQPSFTWNEGKVRFSASETSGTYLIEARLRKGSGCEGEVLDSVTAPFQVAGDHTVTVQYKCGDDFIQASTSVTGKPLEWTEITAPDDIFGYTFSKWKAGDGITIQDDGGSGEKASPTINFKATYEGKLTAIYTKKQLIYFKNQWNWEHVYVNFYTGSYWTNGKGSGNHNVIHRNYEMTHIDGTDVWYYDYGTAGITPSLYVSFTSDTQTDAENFWKEHPGIYVVYPANYPDDINTDKASENGFKAATPMFVPWLNQGADVLNWTGDPIGYASYANAGYWTTYTPGTGYTLEIYNADGNKLLKSIAFISADDLMPMTAVADLEAGHTYKYQIRRGGTGDDGVYYGNSSTMTYESHGQDTPWPMTNAGGISMVTINTNAAGDYTFHLDASNGGTSPSVYRLRMAVDYPVASGDYRVIYKDNVHTLWHPSGIVTKRNNSKDKVSFFIRPGSSPSMKIQQASVSNEGVITWNDVTGGSVDLSSLSETGVYNICLQMNESGAISVEKVEPYTGEYYIRTDAANSKWDNYRAADHLMTYSEYSKDHSDYTHYFVKFVSEGTNVKFVVANDYSPCISDTLIRQTYRGGDSDHVDENGFLNSNLPGDGVNVRYMWDIRNNAVYRAYLAPAQKNGSKFLVLRSNSSDDLRDEYDVALTGESEASPGNNHGGGANCMQFVDNENWIYEATVMVRPSAYVKLYGYFHGTNFYFKGNNNNDFNDTEIDGIPNAIQLVTGSTGSRVKVRVIYDFKTDRLLSALIPDGNIDTPTPINADVMFIREHHEDINQLTFSNGGDLSSINTAYGIIQFNKYTLNNKDKDTHAPLATPASIYERCLYWVSFPFDVKLNEVFGFGTYGKHWIMQYYDGAERAEKGYWAESGSFWKPVWDRSTYVLHANQGYLLTLAVDEDLFTVDNEEIWGPESKSNQIELYFPSYGSMPTITNSEVTNTLPSHKCTIDRTGEGLPPSYNRTIADSHWNVMSVPTYVNTSNIAYANTTWTRSDSCPNFIYTWNADDNTLTATSSSGFMFHAMHAYMVQYYGNVTWSSSVSPSSIVARRTYAETPQEVEFCVELQQDDQMIDRTYIRMSDDEEASTGFVFGEDMSKTLNQGKANIYSFIGSEPAAGNTLPSTDQTTLVPMGVKIATAGTYTISIPAGTYGIGVTLIDEQTGVRTSLSAMDYIVELDADDYTNRFFLEIAPIKTMPTDIENVQGDDVQSTKARKLMIDGILYIRKDGKIYDARGVRIQ